MSVLGQPRSLSVGEVILSHQAHTTTGSPPACLWDPMRWEAEVTPPAGVAVAGRQILSDLIFESVGFPLGLEGTARNPMESGESS
jgi:hypothetical protein